jgi:hypothetical protein
VSGKRPSEKKHLSPDMRGEPRVPGLRQITISYEGRDEEIRVKPPDLSIHGMFISTSRSFPEGTILNLRFQLAHSGMEVETRGEVRYCLPGVGVGVEFIGVSREAERKIAWEIECQTKGRNRRNRNSKSAQGTTRGKTRRLRRESAGH